MDDLISKLALIEVIKNVQEHMREANVKPVPVDAREIFTLFIEMVNAQPTVEAVPLKEVYRIIAGHSDYHGDSILSALTCIAEGKEVKPIKIIEE